GGPGLTIYPDGVKGGEAAMVRRMRTGELQAGMLTVVGLSEIDHSVTALQNMPMVFRTLDEVDYVREKLRPRLEKNLQAQGFVPLFWGDLGWVRFFSKEPGLRPDDFKRMKMFVWAGDAYQVDLMKSAGYHPVPLETNDILPGLQTGLINAVPLTPYSALASQCYTPAPHMLELNWAPLVGGTVLLKSTWDSIPSPVREAMQKAASDAGMQIQERGRTESQEAVEAMKKRGLKVQTVSPELESEWRKSVEEYYPKIRGPIVPADLFDEVQRLLNTYRNSSGKAQ
ncbi:MAG: TRAP transporter substrate-binding protein DctP, partial [Acidobacteriota bacterium]